MPALPYHLRIILQTIFCRSCIFHRRQRLTRTPTPPTPEINKLVTQFIDNHVTPFVNEVTEHTSVDSIQQLRTALIQVNEEYIAREQLEIDNLNHIIHEAQVETHTELEFFGVNADLWHTPLTEEEEAALIAQEAADNEAAELEEFRQACIHTDTFDKAEELQR